MARFPLVRFPAVRPSLALSTALLLLLVAGCSGEGGVQTHNGSLAEGDETLSTGEFSDSYTVRVKAGQWVLVEMSSSAFDPYVILRSPSRNQTENDGEGDRATVRQQATENGMWTVLATSDDAGETGAYTLSISVTDTEPPLAAAMPERGKGLSAPADTLPALADGAQPDTTAAFVVRPGNAPSAPQEAPQDAPRGGEGRGLSRQVQGALEEGDDTLQSGEFTDMLTLDVREGQQIVLDMASRDFDAYLILRSPSGQQVDNDDAGGSRNAHIDHLAGETGTWRVSFTSASPGETGTYRGSVSVR